MRANDFAPPSGTTFKFEKIGDTAEGVVTYVGGWETSEGKFGVQTQCRIALDIDGDNMFIWVKEKSAMARAIADAIRDARIDELTEGAVLKVQYSEDVDTGKGNPMKQYRAKITPGTSNGHGQALPEEEPF